MTGLRTFAKYFNVFTAGVCAAGGVVALVGGDMHWAAWEAALVVFNVAFAALNARAA